MLSALLQASSLRPKQLLKTQRKLLPARCTLALLLWLWASAASGQAPAGETEHTELRQFLISTIDESSSFKDRFDAEVWLLDMSGRLERFIDDPQTRLDLLRAVHQEARAADLKPDLVLALIEVESAFDRYAVSSAGAQGLMQIMPFWKNEIGRPDDNLADPYINLRYGCRILQYYVEKEKGNLMHALARYNGSYGKYWYPRRVFDAWERRWRAGNL